MSISIDDMATEIMNGLTEYVDLATDEMKKAVKKAATKVKTEIKENAPKKTGAYADSWATKTDSEDSNSLGMIVYSKDRYWQAHLLEHGHALRGGGRTSAQPHIEPAQEVGEKLLEEEIERALSG